MDHKQNNKHVDIGLLTLRLGIGIMFVVHGMPKLIGGIDKWTSLGEVMNIIGIGFAPAFWGFMAALAQTAGGILLAAGFLTRTAASFLLFVMLMASLLHITKGGGIQGASHAIESGIVFLTVVITGPGRYSCEALLRARFIRNQKGIDMDETSGKGIV